MKEFYIYEIKSNDNRYYIGQSSICTEKALKEYFGSGVYIKRAILKYGKEFFTKKILWKGFCTKSEIDNLEKEIIKRYKEKGLILFNISDGGQGGDLGIEVRLKIKKALKKFSGKNNPACRPEVRLKISKGNKGKKSKFKGIPRSEEVKKKISEGTKKAMKNIDMKEVCKKIDRNCPSIIEGHKKQGISLKETYKNRPDLIEKARQRRILYNKTHTPKGRHWFTNGKICVFQYECPEGFYPGRIIKKLV